MLETEFVRSLNSNYERIHLSEKPDEHRYQYCILTRGGIRGLLPCSLRYINGEAYLYYDITSRQNVIQLGRKQMIDRNWVREFFRSLDQVRHELGRFLLDEKNILVFPEQIFRDVGTGGFLFLYLPYSTEEGGMQRLLEFVLEHMDYEDERLVECVYSMYEQMDKMEDVYLQEKIFEDAKALFEETFDSKQSESDAEKIEIKAVDSNETVFMKEEEYAGGVIDYERIDGRQQDEKSKKRGFWKFFGGRNKKEQDSEQRYRERMLDRMEGAAVAEEMTYEEDCEDYGKTIYMEQPVPAVKAHKLYTPDGRVAAVLDEDSLTIGKQREEADVLLEDESVSRIHARIYKEDDQIYLEDLNSTNGTFKNGLQLQPYEKRRLEEDDEIRFGKLLFVYR